jgi:hypothetical protein
MQAVAKTERMLLHARAARSKIQAREELAFLIGRWYMKQSSNIERFWPDIQGHAAELWIHDMPAPSWYLALTLESIENPLVLQEPEARAVLDEVHKSVPPTWLDPVIPEFFPENHSTAGDNRSWAMEALLAIDYQPDKRESRKLRTRRQKFAKQQAPLLPGIKLMSVDEVLDVVRQLRTAPLATGFDARAKLHLDLVSICRQWQASPGALAFASGIKKDTAKSPFALSPASDEVETKIKEIVYLLVMHANKSPVEFAMLKDLFAAYWQADLAADAAA